MSLSRTAAAFLLVFSACGDDDAPTDAGADATEDTGGLDSGSDDAAIDAPVDTGNDGGSDDAAADVMPDAGSIGSAGCVDGAGIPEGENTFMLEGLERRYIMRLPTGYSRDQAWPVVLALHGNGGSASYWDGTSGSRDIRSVLADDAVLIVAEAIDGDWRDYDMPPDTYAARIESELLYFDEVLNQARAQLCIDENEIFAMGFSGGGSFSGVLGCRRTDIRAFAAGGAVIYFEEEDCVSAPPAWVTIGTEELTGGRAAFRDFWRDGAMCDDTSTATDPDPCVAYDNCAADTPVHYCQHPGGHTWPNFGSEAMWAFFQQFVD